MAHSDDNLDGSYKVMISLNTILTTGHGLLIFSMFVADYDLIIAPIELFITKIKDKLDENSRLWFKRRKPVSNISEAKCHVNASLQIKMEDIKTASEVNKEL